MIGEELTTTSEIAIKYHEVQITCSIPTLLRQAQQVGGILVELKVRFQYVEDCAEAGMKPMTALNLWNMIGGEAFRMD